MNEHPTLPRFITLVYVNQTIYAYASAKVHIDFRTITLAI